jgi:hypothetical protein
VIVEEKESLTLVLDLRLQYEPLPPIVPITGIQDPHPSYGITAYYGTLNGLVSHRHNSPVVVSQKPEISPAETVQGVAILYLLKGHNVGAVEGRLFDYLGNGPELAIKIGAGPRAPLGIKTLILRPIVDIIEEVLNVVGEDR